MFGVRPSLFEQQIVTFITLLPDKLFEHYVIA